MDGGNDAPREAEVRAEARDGTNANGTPTQSPTSAHNPANQNADDGTPTEHHAGAQTPATETSAGAQTPATETSAGAQTPAAETSAGADVNGAPEPPPERPPLTGLVYYLVGGTLPARYSNWVSRDLTGPGWRLRQTLRPFLLTVPFAVVFALLPGQLSVRLIIVVFLLLSGIGLGFGTSGYFRNHRLVQHGFPPVFPKNDEDD
jgi:hypothetical protein